MAFEVAITPDRDHLRVGISGTVVTIEEIIEYSAQYRAEANRLGLRLVLIDYRSARFDLDYHDLLKLAEYATEKNFQLHGLRIAALCTPEGIEPHRKYETIANNRSISYRAFTEEADALDWLQHP